MKRKFLKHFLLLAFACFRLSHYLARERKERFKTFLFCFFCPRKPNSKMSQFCAVSQILAGNLSYGLSSKVVVKSKIKNIRCALRICRIIPNHQRVYTVHVLHDQNPMPRLSRVTEIDNEANKIEATIDSK